MLKNKDILIFQIINWSLNFIIFYIYLTYYKDFVNIVQAEIMFGAFGAFLLIYSSKNLKYDNLLFFLRYFLILILLFFPSIYSYACISVLAVPAHLPIKLGFKKPLYYLLFIFKLIPLIFFSYENKALIYFLPNLLYGISLYAFYFKENKESNEELDLFQALTHFSSISVLYFLQSLYVVQVMTLSPMLIIFEKLCRSGFGFMQPYIIRFNPDKRKMQYFYLLFFTLLIFGIDKYVLFFIPVIIDSYLVFSGYKKRYDLLFLFIFVLIVYIQFSSHFSEVFLKVSSLILTS